MLSDRVSHVIDQDDVREFRDLTRNIYLHEFVTRCWDRALNAKSVKILMLMNRQHLMIQGMFRQDTDLKTICSRMELITRYAPFFMGDIVDTFYHELLDGPLPDKGEQFTAIRVTVRQYLLTKGYFPSVEITYRSMINTWQLLTTFPDLTNIEVDPFHGGAELLCHLDINPSCFDGNRLGSSFYSLYFRYDNFSTWPEWMTNPNIWRTRMWGFSQENLDCIEALLWQGIKVRRDVFDRLRDDLKDPGKTGDIKIGVKLREMLGSSE
jgi:hypothetical protein